MIRSITLACLAVCGLMYSVSALNVPDEFDNALDALARNDRLMKVYINPPTSGSLIPRSEMVSALAETQRQHDIVKTAAEENGEMTLLKSAIQHALIELVQELRNALGDDNAGRAVNRRHHYRHRHHHN